MKKTPRPRFPPFERAGGNASVIFLLSDVPESANGTTKNRTQFSADGIAGIEIRKPRNEVCTSVDTWKPVCTQLILDRVALRTTASKMSNLRRQIRDRLSFNIAHTQQ